MISLATLIPHFVVHNRRLSSASSCRHVGGPGVPVGDRNALSGHHRDLLSGPLSARLHPGP